MKYKYTLSRHFVRQTKKYIKKIPNLKEDILACIKNLNKQKKIHLGNGIFKIRLSPSAFNKGKSNAFRLIILVVEIKKIITPIAFYFKGDRDAVSKKEIILHKKIIEHELKL